MLHVKWVKDKWEKKNKAGSIVEKQRCNFKFRGQRSSHERPAFKKYLKGMSFPSRGDSRCKGPEVGTSMLYSWNTKEVSELEQ